MTIGAATPVSGPGAATSRSPPRRGTSPTPRSASRRRSAATSAPSASADAPRGDLQAPLIALGATVRSAGKGGERSEPVEDFLADRAGRLVLDVSYDEAAAPGRLCLGPAAPRPPLHDPRRSRRRSGTASSGSPPPASAGAPSGSPPSSRAARSAIGPRAARRRARLGLVSTQLLPKPRRAGARQPRGGPHEADRQRRRARVASPALSPLLYALREELGITSPKAGCQQGGCGACTVLVDGEPRRSCLLPLGAVDGASITTVEGLGTPEQLGVVQAAFHDHYGSQCGFCTPGFLLATHALMERTPRRAARRSSRRSRATTAGAPGT